MMDTQSNPTVVERSARPGDRLVAAIEASTDRIIAAQERAIWRMTWGSIAVAAIGTAVLLVAVSL